MPATSPVSPTVPPPAAAAASPPAATIAAAGGPACGDARPAATVRLSGAQSGRTALLRVPASYDGRHRLPLVVALHGYDQTAAGFDAYTGIRAAGAALGAVVAVPQGVGTPPGWDVPDTAELGPRDTGMLRSLLDVLARTACVDPARVLLAGLSDGADMAVTAACVLGPTRVRAVLLVAASTAPSPRCAAIGVLQVHGTADPVDAYTGRGVDTRRGFGSVMAAGAEQAFARWSALAGCTGRRATNRADLRVLDGTGCRRPVRLVAVQGGGHTWPGAAPRPSLGATTRSLDTRALLRDAAR